MADEQTATQATQDTPPVKGNETVDVSTDTKTESQPGASEPQADDNQTSGEPGEQSEPEQVDKPSRIERRIKQLSSKVREYGESQTTTPPTYQQEQPLISDEEREVGSVDPNILEQRIQGRVQSEVQRQLTLERSRQQYESSVREHQSDLDGLKDIDPDLEADAVAQYEALNYRINPFTGRQEFVPAVKMSEIVAKIEARAEKLAAKRAEAIAAGNEQFIRQVSSTQAVPTSSNVSGSKTIKPETTDFRSFEKAYSSKK